MLNYNSYYLYAVPSDLDPADSEYTVADLRENWSLRAWDGDSGALLAAPMAGAAVAIWGGRPAKPTLRRSPPLECAARDRDDRDREFLTFNTGNTLHKLTDRTVSDRSVS